MTWLTYLIFKTRVYGLENTIDAMQTDIQKQLGVIGERLASLETLVKK